MEQGLEPILERVIDDGFSLQKVIGEVFECYYFRAMALTYGNKSRAAKLLGFSSYQTLDNWRKRYKVSEKF